MDTASFPDFSSWGYALDMFLFIIYMILNNEMIEPSHMPVCMAREEYVEIDHDGYLAVLLREARTSVRRIRLLASKMRSLLVKDRDWLAVICCWFLITEGIIGV